MRAIDLTNRRYGRLLVKEYSHRQSNRRMWLCSCDCGKETKVSVSNLISGNTLSCGCFEQESRFTHRLTHGLEGTRVYNIWVNMKQRCLNQNHHTYKYYGARGIKVCDEWLDFGEFFKSMGKPKRNDSIERIDPNGNYQPSNCRWIHKSLQSRNTRNAISATLKGKTRLLIDWCERKNLNYKVVQQRVKRDGLTPEQALLKPISKSRKGVMHKPRKNKAIRDDQIARNGSAELEEGRSDE